MWMKLVNSYAIWLDITPDLSGQPLISPYNVNSLSIRQVRRRENVIKVKSVLLMPVSSFVVWFTVLTVLQKVHLLLQARNQCEYVISVLRTSHQAQPRYTPLIFFIFLIAKVVCESGWCTVRYIIPVALLNSPNSDDCVTLYSPNAWRGSWRNAHLLLRFVAIQWCIPWKRFLIVCFADDNDDDLAIFSRYTQIAANTLNTTHDKDCVFTHH